MFGDVEGGDGGVVCLFSVKLVIGKCGFFVVNFVVEVWLYVFGKLCLCSFVEVIVYII